MKHLELFEYFGNDILYHELKSDEELDNFLINHTEQPIEQKIIDKINKFINKHDYLGIEDAFTTKMSEVDIDYDEDVNRTSNEVILLEDTNSHISYMIGIYSDNWFLVGVVRQDDEYNQSEWNFKCDTMKGLYQLIMQWDSFHDVAHWDDDQPIDYEEEEEEEYDNEEEDDDEWDEE